MKARIICNTDGCLNLKDGRCALDGIRVDPKTGTCLSVYLGSMCDSCNEGKARNCPHAEGRHYDAWGEGLSAPWWCPQQQEDEEELPFC